MDSLRQKTTSICVFAFFFALAFSNFLRASDDGLSVLIEACRNVGDNPTLIKSMYLEVEEVVESVDFSPERFEKIKAEMTRDFLRMYADDPETLKQSLAAIPDIIKGLNSEQRTQQRFLLRVDDTVRHVTKSSTRGWMADAETWDEWQTVLQRRADRAKGEKGISVKSEHKDYSVAVGVTSFNVVAFHRFGRIQGATSIAVSLGLLGQRDDYSKYDFLQENVDRFKKSVADAEKTTNFFFCRIVGNAIYDDDVKCVVLESSLNGIITERYWIDTSRGYICPLAQLYYPDTGNIAQEYIASEFFQDKESQLWYPSQYSETIYENEKEKIRSKRNYTIDKITFRVNQIISDKEFAVDVPERAIIDDSRSEEQTTYRAIKPGTLSLAPDGLDLDKMDWLHKGSDMPGTSDGEMYTEEYRTFLQEQERRQQLQKEEVDRQMKEETEKHLLEQEEMRKELERKGQEYLKRETTFQLPTPARFSTFQIGLMVTGLAFIAWGLYLNFCRR